jgi:D-arabinose 1-dehydrogenase-like Zn-dependent alcohol dehydrogenase
MATSQSVREQAAKLNPIISLVGMPDTLSQCAQMVDQLGRFVASAAESGDSSIPLMHLLTGAISSALNFELEASNV